MKNIGILGGTFNPVHFEHIEIAKSAIKELSLDKLFIMPTFISPHKTLIPASAEDRINMLKLAFKGIDKVEISTYEVDKKGTSYTYQTAEEFKRIYKDANIYFICGGDMLNDFRTWKYPERILNSVNLAVFSREDYFTDFSEQEKFFIENYKKSFIKLNYNGKKCSSTKIRVYSAFSLPLDDICIKSVKDYILEHNLYVGDKYTDFVKSKLPLKRIIHTANVCVTALSKTKELNLDGKKVFTACALHDVAKYLSCEDYVGYEKIPNMPSPVVHAYLGAYICQTVLGITDEDIINAVRYHTSGRANMSVLEKLVFVADMIEEGRDYDGVETLRKYYEKDLDTCFKKCLEEELFHLRLNNQEIFDQTVKAYEYYFNGKEN